MMNPVPWLQMTNMISYQGLVRTFPKPQLERRDIVIEELNVQIGYSGTLVPFRINGVDDRRFFGMSGCASLDSVEYATEFLTQH